MTVSHWKTYLEQATTKRQCRLTSQFATTQFDFHLRPDQQPLVPAGEFLSLLIAPFNALYWSFLIRAQDQLASNPQLAVPYR